MMFTPHHPPHRQAPPEVTPSEARGLVDRQSEIPRCARNDRRDLSPPLSVSPSLRLSLPSRLRVSREPRAFTLIELMLSIALVLLLMLGVNSIFKTTSDAVGAGQRLGDAIRGQQAMQSVLSQDFASALQDPPLFWIANEQVYMYLNAEDHRADGQADEPWFTDLDANGVRGEPRAPGDPVVPGERVPAFTLNYRSHRIDSMGFFARGNFRRNTGNTGEEISQTTSTDAFIWYGHAMMPDKEMNVYLGPNDGNKLADVTGWYGVFAADWIFVRQVMLLRNQSELLGDPSNPNDDEIHYPRQPGPLPGYSMNATPLQFNSPPWDPNPGIPPPPPPLPPLQTGRYDLLGVTLEELRSIVQQLISESTSWWWQVPLLQPVAGQRPLRFQSDPIIITPLTADNAARVVNQLTQGVSQFAIEYAGDYVTQDGNGVPTLQAPDGVLDWVPLDSNNDNVIDGRSIRWYGMPRDVDGDGVILGWRNGYPTTVAGMIALRDVIPLRDFRSIGQSSVTRAAHEVEIRNLPTADRYENVHYSNGNAGSPMYLCVWVNDTPAMIRILTKVDDPNNRLKDGPWQEMVFSIKR